MALQAEKKEISRTYPSDERAQVGKENWLIVTFFYS